MAYALLRAAVLGFPLALWSSGQAAGAPDAAPGEFQPLEVRLQAELSADRLWEALRLAERRAALPGLSSAQRADAFLDEAEIRSLVGDHAGAERALQGALRLRPGDPEASLLLAQLTRDRPEQALGLAEQAARAAASPRRRAAAYRLAGEIQLDLDDKSGAQSSLARALELGGDDLDTLRVMVWSKRDEPLQAAAYALRACRAAEAVASWQRAAAYRLCAQILIDSKDFAGARASLRRALALDPDDLKALQAMVQIERQGPQAAPTPEPDDLEALRALFALKRAEDRLPEAAALAERFTAAIRKAPAWLQTDAYRLSARMWLELGDAERVGDIWRRAEKVDRDSLISLPDVPGERRPPEGTLVDSYETIARARVDLGDQAEAQATLQRALARFPGEVRLLRGLVALTLSRRKPEEALAYVELLDKASETASPAERAGVCWQKTQLQLELKDEAGAQTSLERALELAPGHAPALQELVRLKLAQGRPEEALAGVARLAEAREKASPAERAGVYWQKARIQRQLKDEAGAQASLERALELMPAHAPALQELVRLKLGQGRLEEALAHVDLLAKASEKAPPAERAGVYWQTAQIQRELKDEPGAQRSLERGLELAPDHAPALAELAGVHQRKARVQRELKDEPGARASLERALELAPGHAPALRDLIELKLAQGRPEEALADLEHLAKASEKASPSERAGVYRQKARIQRQLKDEAGAQASLERARDLAPGHAPALQDLIELKLAQGRPEEALAGLERLAKASEKASPAERAGIFRQKARIQRRLKDEAGAQASLERALEAAPEDLRTLWLLAGRRSPREALSLVAGRRPTGARLQAPWLVLRGLARLRLEEDAAAREDLSAAVRLDATSACFDEIFLEIRDRLDPLYFDPCVERFPQDASLYLDRGVARFLSGRQDGALADFHKAVELKPDYPEAYLSLASALAFQGRSAEALAAADRAVARAKDAKGPVYDRLAALRSSLRAAR